ncbi:MAG: hypothetical protein QOF12_2371, partial [Solirubrobacteraceae bacterium]|nr:hypothetical protein [Solirubrobacteraceae bacterium]
MRKLLLPALAACALLAAGAPVASAHKSHVATVSLGTKLSRAAGAIKGLEKTVKALFNNDSGQKDAIHTVDGKVAALGATVQGILSGVPLITGGLTALGTALADPVTGLVGLNHARPQFGAFTGAGVIIGGTGQTTGASGPKANVISTGAVPGVYVVDFGNDVSLRVFSVNVFPPGPGTTVPSAGATDCGVSSSAAALCAAAEGSGTPDASVNHVAIQIGNGTAAAPAGGFSVTAISG